MEVPKRRSSGGHRDNPTDVQLAIRDMFTDGAFMHTGHKDTSSGLTYWLDFDRRATCLPSSVTSTSSSRWTGALRHVGGAGAFFNWF